VKTDSLRVTRSIASSIFVLRLNRLVPSFSGASADGIIYRQDEDFAIADLAGTSSDHPRMDRAP
jgi:hypothetical protein